MPALQKLTAVGRASLVNRFSLLLSISLQFFSVVSRVFEEISGELIRKTRRREASLFEEWQVKEKPSNVYDIHCFPRLNRNLNVYQVYSKVGYGNHHLVRSTVLV